MSSHEIISLYHSDMYESVDQMKLRTGDVIRLELEEIKSIVRHESVLSLFENYDQNGDYDSKLWAVLNKPCDMVHLPAHNRYFRNNLFLVPLQSLRTALKKGTLGELLHSDKIIAPEKLVLDNYKKYFTQKAKNDNSKEEHEDAKQYNIRLQEQIVNPVIEKIKALTEDLVVDHPEDLLEVLKTATKGNENIHSTFEEFQSSDYWKKPLANYNEKHQEILEKDSKIILKADVAKGKLAELTLNQLDSQGIFFYEPDSKISDPEHDLSYIIQLEDMITLKINREAQESGRLVDLLKEKRVVMLKRNFSDRLLNIMGNYFSKIGTPDVDSDKVLLLYKRIYKNDFFMDINDYDKSKKP